MTSDSKKPSRSQARFVPQDKTGFDRPPVSNEEPCSRRTACSPAQPARGHRKLYVDLVLQADQGGDFDFLIGRSASLVPRRSLKRGR